MTRHSRDAWALDCARSPDPDNGMFCFVPVEDGAFITGLSFMSDRPPGKLVAIFHEDGQAAVEAFIDKHREKIDAIRAAKREG